MNTYLISYDLRIPEKSDDYKKIIDYIKSYGYYAKPLKSLWFIKTDKTVSLVRDELINLSDSNDGIIVVDVTKRAWGCCGIEKEVTDWMKNNL